jgi:signal transduction histidine kinase
MTGSEDLEAYLKMGIRAAQTTPLLSRSGALLGVFSTHWRQPHDLTAGELWSLDVLARQAADIIEKKQAEERLRASEEQLRQGKVDLERKVAERTTKLRELVGELEHFSYTITHDLKSPLRAMKGYAEITATMCGDSARKEVKEALSRISISAERMECLITDALNYSRAVRQELPLTNVDTGALLNGMLESCPDLQPSKVNIRVEGKLPTVEGNEAGLTQCFSNLLVNAVKFVKPGEKPLIRVWAEQRGDWARIWVEDNGIGISKDMLPRVFDMFSRGSTRHEGTGIGLALVRKVTQRMGGRTGVESEEGKGSRFWIEVKSTKGGTGAAMAKPNVPTVLYVEDDEADTMFMKMAFARQGME